MVTVKQKNNKAQFSLQQLPSTTNEIDAVDDFFTQYIYS